MLVRLKKNGVTYLYTAGRTVKCYSHSGNQFGSFLKSNTCREHMTQQLHSQTLSQGTKSLWSYST